MATRKEVPDIVAERPVAPTVEPQKRLLGKMGVGELVMSVLAFSAPLTTVAGFIRCC